MLFNADDYFKTHIENESWDNQTKEQKESLLDKAKAMIDESFDLRNGVTQLDVYQFAIFEQAIYLLTFDKERSRLQREGVYIYKYDDLTFHMNGTTISPISAKLLKKHSYKRTGEIV